MRYKNIKTIIALSFLAFNFTSYQADACCDPYEEAESCGVSKKLSCEATAKIEILTKKILSLSKFTKELEMQTSELVEKCKKRQQRTQQLEVALKEMAKKIAETENIAFSNAEAAYAQGKKVECYKKKNKETENFAFGLLSGIGSASGRVHEIKEYCSSIGDNLKSAHLILENGGCCY